jgi:transcription antitermination factor NusG
MSNSQPFFRDEDISGQNPACPGAVLVQSWPVPSATWYAIYTKCHHEFTIWSQLQKKSIENFFPCVTRWSRRKDRKLKIQVPLFPGYIFVRIKITPYHALEVLKINGVVRFLGESNQRPVDIPDIQIESLKTVIASGEQILPFAYLRVGQRVCVRRGPFEG